MNMNAREAAFNALSRIRASERYSNLEIDSSIKKYELQDSEKSLFTALVYGVIEREITLDYIVSQFSKVQFNKLENNVICLLRLGIYQIVFLDKIPDSAACNETVNLCKIYAKTAVPFVNAVLRSVSRSKEGIVYPNRSVLYSVPEWLCKMWTDMYGEEQTIKILKSVNRKAPVTLRVNTLKITRDELLDKLADSEPIGINGVNIPSVDLKLIDEGLCYVQDEAAQQCAHALDTMPNMFVIDSCAAPGGKSFYYSIEMKNTGKVTSMDLHLNKLILIGNTASKLGIKIIKTKQQDGTVFNPELVDKADRVACDVPCSGFGVIAKKPELRYKSNDDIKNLPELQYKILKINSKYLKKGGILVYSTCTLNKCENEEVVMRFLNSNSNFKLIDFGMKTIFPNEFNTDGFFMAKLQYLPD